MIKNKKRDLATSLTSVIFLVMGTTGVFMYFHILDGYTKDMHEILGLAFVVVVLFHVMYNWNSMKTYFKKKIFLSSFSLIFLIVLGFIFASGEGKNPKKLIIMSLLKAPIEESLSILGSDIDTFEEKLKKANIQFDDESSLMQIARNNKKSPFEIVNIVIKK